MVRVDIRYFAAVRDRVGLEREQVDLPARGDAAALLARIAEQHPAAAELIRGSRLAVDLAFVVGEVALRDGVEIAVIPPVSGG